MKNKEKYALNKRVAMSYSKQQPMKTKLYSEKNCWGERSLKTHKLPEVRGFSLTLQCSI